MTLDEYQKANLRTYPRQDFSQLAYLALGLAGEAGEVADHVKKYIGHGHPLDAEKVKRELGDVLSYLAVIAKVLGAPLSEIAQINVDKLKARYPNGFTQDASLNRAPEDT